jgi:hypothetical protein
MRYKSDHEDAELGSQDVTTCVSYSGSPDFNCGKETAVKTDFSGFPQRLQENVGTVSLNRPLHIPFIFFPIHYSKLTLQHYVT